MLMRLFCTAGLWLLCMGAGAAEEAVPAFLNGGFERMESSGELPGWVFGCSDECRGAMAIDRAIKAEGDQSICLSSATEEAPHVYCGLSQRVDGLTPGKVYRFSLKAKGESVGMCWFGGGPGWTLRYVLPAESFDWEEFAVEWACPEGTTEFEFRVNVDSVTGGLWIDDAQVAEALPGSQLEDDPAAAARITEAIGRQEQRIPALEGALVEAVRDGVPVFYPKAALTLAKMFCGYCRQDIANKRIGRAAEVAQEVEELLNRAEQDMRQGVDVPVLKPDSPIAIREGSLWGACLFGGQEVERPVFLIGYGHFLRVVEDLEIFRDTGINVIQIEIGPNSTVFEEGPSDEAVRTRILPALDRARENGVQVCLLLSPHYFPQWAYDKWPDLEIDKPGFLKTAVDAPQAREIIRAHIETVISAIKGHPALHSICLSNEPLSENGQNDPFRLPLWRAYIERKHKTIEALNAAYGTDYGSFAEAPHPHMTFDEKPGPLYDGVRFNQECFAAWHQWMTELIHGIAPELPCHAKVMHLPGGRDTVLWGTDPWDFAQLSQLNGNDCYFMQSPKGSRWASDFSSQGQYYDLQRSMKRVPIFNTENHIIRDREKAHIDEGHIYTAIWQGAIHGQGASTAWVWERTYDPKSDFEGSILHRPLCAAAMSRCGLDLMRCAREVSALQNLEPRVALLYSHAATIHDAKYVSFRARVYDALNFCGIPIGFVTDEQTAAGALSRYACVVLPGAAHVSGEAIGALRDYAAAGGAVIAYGAGNAAQDEYGRAAEPPAFTAEIALRRPSEAEGLRDAFFEQLTARGLGPGAVVRTPAGKLPYGVEWRSAELEGRRLLNLVNFRRAAQEIHLPEGEWMDMISGVRLHNPVTLPADRPVLAAGL